MQFSNIVQVRKKWRKRISVGGLFETKKTQSVFFSSMVKVTLNITFVRCFAWKIAGELDICISMTEYRTGYVFITASNLLFFSTEEPRNIKPLYNAGRSLAERRISFISVLVKYMVKNLHITRPWYSELILPGL